MTNDKTGISKLNVKRIPAAAVLATSVLLSNFAGAVPAFADATQATTAGTQETIHSELSHILGIVAKAEQDKQMADLIHARQDVNEMPESNTKAALQDRLRAVEQQLLYGNPLDDAKFYVAEVEQCLCTDVFRIASSYVSQLSAGPVKDELNTRLEAAKYKIDNKAAITAVAAATGAVTQAETVGNQEVVDYAKYAVNQLPDSQDKQNLLNRLAALDSRLAGSVALATTAVNYGEQTKLQNDYDSADGLVKALPSSAAKQALSDRLSTVDLFIHSTSGGNVVTDNPQQIAQATQAVSYAESVRTTANYNTASALINTLTPGATKTALFNRLNTINLIGDIQVPKTPNAVAEEAVKTAEYMRTQQNYENAKNLVDNLAAGSDQDILLKRLSVVKDYVDKMAVDQQSADAIKSATDKVGTAESSRSLVDYNNAEFAVQALPMSSSKTTLLQRLSVVKTYIDQQTSNFTNRDAINNATDQVSSAENYRTQASYDLAMSSVDQLPASADKTTLLSRLSVVKSYLDDKASTDSNAVSISYATDAVSKAETIRTKENYDAAKGLVDALPDSSSRQTLLNRLVTIKNYLDTHTADQSVANSQTTTPASLTVVNNVKAPTTVAGIQKTEGQAAAEKQILSNLKNNWVKNDAQKLIDRNIFIWDNPTSFKPNDKVSQEEFVALVARAYQTDMSAVNTGTLKDKFAQEIKLALDKGFIKSTSTLQKPVTREDAVKMLVSVLRQKAYIPVPSTNLVNNFKDGKTVGFMSRSDFNYALQIKLIYGDSKRKLNPQATLTKAEAIAFVSRLIDKIPAAK